MLIIIKGYHTIKVRLLLKILDKNLPKCRHKRLKSLCIPSHDYNLISLGKLPRIDLEVMMIRS